MIIDKSKWSRKKVIKSTQSIIVGDCIKEIRKLQSNSVHAVVTDPPYFLTNESGSGFMGKSWDSLSPENAVVESCFRLMKLGLNMDEGNTAPENDENLQKKKSYLIALYVKTHSKGQSHILSQSTSFAVESVLTRDEALVLCKELLPNHITYLQSLPRNAVFVVDGLNIGSLNRNIVRQIACILQADPEWLDLIIPFTKMEKARREEADRITGEKGGTKLEKEFTEEITQSNAISNPILFQKIIQRIISLPSVARVIAESNQNQNFIPIISEVFHYKWASECLRVLKPGGHMLAFAGTRTYHRMVSAIQDVGFEIRDQVQWIYGSGFPKSLNVSKAIDKLAGVEVKSTYKPNFKNNTHGHGHGGGVTDTTTKPTTADAIKYEGWGTALKPSNEPIVLCRKPLSEKSITENVLRHGSGALNIDSARIGNNAGWAYPNGAGGNTFHGADRHDTPVTSNKGRFPSNTIFSHHADCVLVGSKDVKAITGGGMNRDEKNPTSYSFSERDKVKTVGFGKDGKETVEDWNCHPECPIFLLDEQSGVLKSGDLSPDNNVKDSSGWSGGSKANRVKNTFESNSGGASRFFMVFNNSCGLEQTVVDDMSAGKKTENKKENLNTDIYGSKLTGLYLSDTIYTTGTETLSTITFQILSASTQKPIGNCIVGLERTIKQSTVKSIVGVSVVDNTNCVIHFSDEAQAPIRGTVKFVQKNTYKNGETKTELNTTSITGSIEKNACKFFYCAKPSNSEKNRGLDGLEEKVSGGMDGTVNGSLKTGSGNERNNLNKNFHPTVKPIKLMEYLIKMISKEGQTILDPFVGSGTTLVAAKNINRSAIGIEKDPEYAKIAQARLNYEKG